MPPVPTSGPQPEAAQGRLPTSGHFRKCNRKIIGCRQLLGPIRTLPGSVNEAVVSAQDAGKVRYIGYSGDGAAALWAVRCGSFQAIQISVNVADRQAIDDIISEALSAGLGIIAKRPIANAVWRSAHMPQDPHMHVYWSRICALDYRFIGAPDAIAEALRFTLRTGVHTATVGTTSLPHIRSNIEAIRDLNGSDPRYEEIRDRWRQIAGPDWIGQMSISCKRCTVSTLPVGASAPGLSRTCAAFMRP